MACGVACDAPTAASIGSSVGSWYTQLLLLTSTQFLYVCLLLSPSPHYRPHTVSRNKSSMVIKSARSVVAWVSVNGSNPSSSAESVEDEGESSPSALLVRCAASARRLDLNGSRRVGRTSPRPTNASRDHAWLLLLPRGLMPMNSPTAPKDVSSRASISTQTKKEGSRRESCAIKTAVLSARMAASRPMGSENPPLSTRFTAVDLSTSLELRSSTTTRRSAPPASAALASSRRLGCFKDFSGSHQLGKDSMP
mmetsp:Transcript_87469/g.175007  ORF Transcript_87469/g.175007 Transcript_87469/m.175007 type:complete len:252 (-) Transcript_87469:950-1705(-)